MPLTPRTRSVAVTLSRPHERSHGRRPRPPVLRLIVLEEHVSLGPLLSSHLLSPIDELAVGIVELVQPQVSPRRRAHYRTPEVILLGDAHRDVAVAHRRVDLVVEPALVAELEDVASILGEQAKESAEAVYVLLEIRRKLE